MCLNDIMISQMQNNNRMKYWQELGAGWFRVNLSKKGAGAIRGEEREGKWWNRHSISYDFLTVRIVIPLVLF